MLNRYISRSVKYLKEQAHLEICNSMDIVVLQPQKDTALFQYTHR